MGEKSEENGKAAAARPRHALTYRDYAAFARMDDAAILRVCEVQVFRATGPGGQGVNTTDSAVRMRHVPTGITVVSRETRSQYQNRQTCLAKLRAAFEQRARRPSRAARPRCRARSTSGAWRASGRRADVKKARRRVDW